MQSDEFLRFLADIRSKAPHYGELLALIEEAYAVSSMPRIDMDFHFVQAYPPGHYYSPLPSRAELALVSERVFRNPVDRFCMTRS